MRATESLAVRPATRLAQPVVIGHRGAPAYRPEHTAASYQLAIDLGAELIEPDVVVSRDGVLVVRHESELSLSTDVADRAGVRRPPHHQGRRRPTTSTGWFAEDFTLAELRTLRAVERMPELRPLNTAYDGHFGILTLGEVDLAGPHPVHRRPPDPGARRAQARRLVDRARPADGRAGRRGAAPARRDRRRRAGHACSPSTPACCATCARCSASDGPQMVQLVHDDAAGDRMVTRAGPARDLHLRAGHRPQPRAHPRHRTDGRSGPLRSSTRRTGPRCRSSAGRCGRRTPSCPSTCASGDAPEAPRRRARRGPPAARPRRRRPDHRLPRPRRPGRRGAADTRLTMPAYQEPQSAPARRPRRAPRAADGTP